MSKFHLDQEVEKTNGYSFPGTVVAVFTTLAGELRYVVEMDEHRLLHIFNETQLQARK
jgi:hypothetical protein